jgi:hypothetical protein
LSVLSPARSTAEMWTNASLPPPDKSIALGWIEPLHGAARHFDLPSDDPDVILIGNLAAKATTELYIAVFRCLTRAASCGAAVDARALGGIRCQLDQLDVVLWLVDLSKSAARASGRPGSHQRARHRDAGQMRWVILDLGELPCLIDVSKLNPGPSGEDADAVGQPRDVGSPCTSAC